MFVSSINSATPFLKINFGATFSGKKENIQSTYLHNDIFEKQSNINEKSDVNLRNINVICKDEIENPSVSVFLVLNDDIYKNREEIDFVYSILMNKKFNELFENSTLTKNKIFAEHNYKELDVTILNRDLNTELKNIKGNFLDLNFTKEELDDAKDIAKEIFILLKRIKNTPDNIAVFNKNISVERFCKTVDKINMEDILEYKKDLLQNSDIDITTYISKDFYNEHPDFMNEINDIFTK